MRSKVNILVSICLGSILLTCCKENLLVSNEGKTNSICYMKQVNHHWEIYSNDETGNNPVNISDSLDNNEQYPEWSPDGKYIAYNQSREWGGHHLIVHEIKTGKKRSLGTMLSQPKWTGDCRIYYTQRQDDGIKIYTCLIKPDGTEKIIVLDFEAQLFFYPDNNTFLYTTDYQKYYKSNIQNSFNWLVLDCNRESPNYITVRDFDLNREKLLVNTNYFNNEISELAEFDITTGNLKLLLASEGAFGCALQRYSKDYNTIAFIEADSRTHDSQYLSILTNGIKRRLVKLTGGMSNEWFDFNPMEFSPDGKLLAYSKNVTNSGGSISWESSLYVVEIKSGHTTLIDRGINPSWNPHYK